MEANQLSVTKHFFKVMMPGFHHKLNLPPRISKELKDQTSRRAILESRTGTWRVSLGRSNETGLICLKQGWPQFVERHALTLGEFVFFQLTGDLHFNVSVYATNMCEKEFRDDDDEENEKEGTQTLIPPRKTTMEEAADGIASFEKVMVPHHARKTSKVNLPSGFMRANNLGGRQQSCVVLNDPDGRAWPVSLLAETFKGIRFRMRKGWRAFYASNGLKDGDTCVFYLNRRLLTPTTIVFDVKIFRVGNSS